MYSGAATSYTRTATVTGAHTYRVQACNGGGCSDWKVSSTVAVTIPPGSAPTLTAPSSSNTGAYTVSWTGVSGATSYTLQEQTNGGSWSTVQSSSAASKAISGKGNGTYGYRVQACNVGGCSGWSATDSTTVLHPPGTPGTPNAQQTGSSSKPTVSVTWSSVATATSYQLEQSGGGEATSVVYNGSGTSFSQIYLQGGSFQFRVKACNASGCSGWSGYKSIYVTSGL